MQQVQDGSSTTIEHRHTFGEYVYPGLPLSFFPCYYFFLLLVPHLNDENEEEKKYIHVFQIIKDMERKRDGGNGAT